ncbi:hypothetical protein B566_EDAN014040, partial [Ephemera danica]
MYSFSMFKPFYLIAVGFLVVFSLDLKMDQTEVEKVRVVARIRPLKQAEQGLPLCIKADTANEIRLLNTDTTTKSTYSFSAVFNESTTDLDVFSATAKPLVPSLFQGYNVTMIAYGQTGSGKSHTLGTSSGTEEPNPHGIIPLCLAKIFSIVEAEKAVAQFAISMSLLEIYMNNVRDLMVPKESAKDLVVKERGELFIAEGLTTKAGLANRTTASTSMNKHSSRSHCLFNLKIERMPVDGSKATVGTFCVMDLAGSENVCNNEGPRRKEGININQGLFYLGTIIKNLVKKTHSYVNYRQSNLTRLMKASLGGNSKTIFFACINALRSCEVSTRTTLDYADSASKIRNKPIQNSASAI